MRRAGLLFESSDGADCFLVEAGRPVVVGRRPPVAAANVRLADTVLARQHVRIAAVGDGFVVDDPGSTGTSFVDDLRIAGQAIAPGAVLRMTGTMVFTARAFGGEALATVLARGRLVRAEARAMLGRLARSLGALHAVGRCRGVYTPGEILRGDDEGWVLLAPSAAGPDAATALAGDPRYLAPELVEGVLDAASDLYTLGLIYFEALAGRRPFDEVAPAMVMSAKRHGAMPRWEPDWDEGQRDLLRRLLASVPSQRVTAAGLRALLEEPWLD